MRVWTYPEKKYETLGAERWEVTWYEPAHGVDPDDDSVDFDDRYVTKYKVFPTAEAARTYANEVWQTRPLMFGVVEIQRQIVDWFVEEDRVAEWANVGDAEQIE